MYTLGADALDPETHNGQAILRNAYNGKLRPLCNCTDPKPQMYIAYVRAQYIVKRMPTTGADHNPDCASYLPPEELSGLSQVRTTAIEEMPEDGTTLLRLDFPLSIRGKHVAPPPGSGEDTREAKTPERKLTLTSLLHYLWYEGDLVKWVPKMHGKRWWGIVQICIQDATANKIAKRQNMAAKLYIPEPFKSEHKEEIAARRTQFFSNIYQSAKGDTPLGILVAEYKTHTATRLGARFIFKQLPDCPFFADEQLVKRFNRIFEANIQLADMVEDAHVMVIATFSIAKAGYPVLHELGMMLTTKNWIPFEHMREVELIEKLTNTGRKFTKSLRFNLSKKTAIASLVLTDLETPVACFVSAPSDDGGTITELVETAEQGTYPAWLWTDDAAMPNLPT